MRTEQLTAKALEKVNHDKYLLANAVGKRAEAISKGATPKVNVDVKTTKATDIALMEIAEGKLIVNLEE